VDFLHGFAKGGPIQKDTAGAALCREQGNGSFKIRDYAGATLHYSQVKPFTVISTHTDL